MICDPPKNFGFFSSPWPHTTQVVSLQEEGDLGSSDPQSNPVTVLNAFVVSVTLVAEGLDRLTLYTALTHK